MSLEEELVSLDKQLASYRFMAGRSKLAGLSGSGPGWMSFAAASGASLAGVSSADAVIQHFVPEVPFRVNVAENAATAIDLNMDSIYDVVLGAAHSGGGLSGFNVAFLYGIYNAAVQVGGFVGYGSYSVARYEYGEQVYASFGGYGSVVRLSGTAFGSPQFSNGQWGVSDIGYAGFIDTVGGTPRAGWIKVRTEADGAVLGAVEVLEWAYETERGVRIEAGDIGSAPIPGDYDGNGSVGPEDYDEWKDAFGDEVSPGIGADGNENGVVDAADYNVWRDNQKVFGTGSLVQSTTVPEPSTVTLGVLALGAAGVAALRRRS